MRRGAVDRTVTVTRRVVVAKAKTRSIAEAPTDRWMTRDDLNLMFKPPTPFDACLTVSAN